MATLQENLEAATESARDGFFHLEPEVMECWLDAVNHLQGWWTYVDTHRIALQYLRIPAPMSPEEPPP